MYIVVVHNWQMEESEAAKTIADIMNALVFEARQKIANGGPAVLVNFADQVQAETLANKLAENGVPAFVIDPVTNRKENRSHYVHSFILGPQSLQLELSGGELCNIDYDTIEQLLVATCNVGQTKTPETVTTRKFSLGKTLLAGGVPMTKKVKSEEPAISNERDETLWLYTRGHATMIFDRGTLNYNGLGDAMQLTRDLNFTHLKSELHRLAGKACYDERLLKRAELIRLLGPTLNPEADLDLAFEILSQSLREKTDSKANGL